MAGKGAGRRPTGLRTLTEQLLQRARGEDDPARLWTLTTVCQGLRERLDACDDQLGSLLADAEGAGQVAGPGRPVPTPQALSAAYAAIAEELRRLEDQLGR